MAHYKGAASEGGRALQLQKQREKALEDLELRKKKIVVIHLKKRLKTSKN